MNLWENHKLTKGTPVEIKEATYGHIIHMQSWVHCSG